uniref:Integrator complex subunit 7 n=1 Tax=Ananas comosus var. bracteatus TaxID=296719 RepID=A0A6V7Q618_ANACO|nr:unnamed protein product [Ananas comosus var. bracteatus]
MDKITAACAMEWSIDLEKGLRSNKPGQRIAAIEQISHRIRELSIESNITKAVSDMYGLVPGEDRLFSNTILLRLADAFRRGDNHMRRCILKVFLGELRHLSKKGKMYNGILAKHRVPNYVELLRRVKVVFDTGDQQAKSLALRLFGCWADLAKDSAQIRYVILSSLQSSHVSEVMAALFAAGCFCLLAEDFSCIILEVSINLICSSGISAIVKRAAIRSLSMMQCTLSIISSTYKAGKRLVLSSMEDDFKAEMLLTLSKLASKSTILIAEQVDLLLSFLKHESTALLKARALKCLGILFSRYACHFPINTDVLGILHNVIEDSDLTLNFQCEALRILRQIFGVIPSSLSSISVPDLSKLVLNVEGAALSASGVKRSLAFHLLVDILCCLRRAMEEHSHASPEEKLPSVCSQFQDDPEAILLTYGENELPPSANRATTLIMDYLISLAKQVMSKTNQNMLFTVFDGDLKQEYNTSLSLILRLAEDYPSSLLVALDKIRCIIQTLGNVDDNVNTECIGTYSSISKKDSVVKKPNPDNSNFPCDSLCKELDAKKPNLVFAAGEYHGESRILVVSELMLTLCKFSNASLNKLNDFGQHYCYIYLVVKHLVECIKESAPRYYDTYEIFCLCMYSHLASNRCKVISEKEKDLRLAPCNLEAHEGVTKPRYFIPSAWAVQERRALGFAKKMIRERNYWTAYRVGKYSFCKGLWFAATFVFRKLIHAVKSSSFSCWLTSLMLLAGGESEIKLLLFPKIGIELISELQAEGICEKEINVTEIDMEYLSGTRVDICYCEGKLGKICNRIWSSEETLALTGPSDGLFYFQRWFICLRAEFLEIVVEIFGFLSSHSFAMEVLNKEVGNENIHFAATTENMKTLLLGLTNKSLRLNQLAKNYDLLATSFLDIDHQSFRSICRLAFNCSMLAFCTAFAMDFSISHADKNIMPCSFRDQVSYTPVVQDLFMRLGGAGSKITTQFEQFMSFLTDKIDLFRSRTQLNCANYLDRDYLLIFQFALQGLLCIRRDAKGVIDKGELQSLVNRGLQLLYDILQKSMELPFQLPRYYFRTRHCIGAELFIFGADSGNKDEIITPPGFQLSLNLCIQLKNMLARTSAQLAKLYCILAARVSSRLPLGKGEAQNTWEFRSRKMNEMVQLNAMLLHYLKEDAGKANEINIANGDEDLVTACVCFEPNERGQGFSICLLNVSAFPEGSYQINWHSCCIDTNGSHWSLLPLNAGVSFSVKRL